MMLPGDGPTDPPTMSDGEYIQRLEVEVQLLQKLYKLHEELLVAYRRQRHPRGKCLDDLRELKERLKNGYRSELRVRRGGRKENNNEL